MKRDNSKLVCAVRAGLASLSMLLAGCASTPPPLAELARADASLGLARQADAQTLAPLELDSSEQKLKQARMAMRAEDYVTARRLAEQAEVEAELAQAKAQSARMQQSVQQVRESIRVLREEIGGASGASVP